MFHCLAIMPANCNRSSPCRFRNRIATAVALVAAAHAVVAQPANAATGRRPNIIIIMSDDMGFSDIGCYGGEIATPHLDGLADGGLRFTHFYNTARCCPTRASLLTGLYPHQAGVGWMMSDNGFDGYRGNLNKNCRTIAEVVRTAGYRTYAVGKWHVTRHTDPAGPKFNWPLQRGFDRFYGTIHGAGSFFDPNTLMRDNTMISPYADPEYQPDEYYYTDAISDHAVRFIDQHFNNPEARPIEPFFMYVAYTAAHWPMHALEKDIQKYRGKYDGGYAAIRKARLKKMKQLGVITQDTKLSPGSDDWSKVKNREWEIRCMEVYAAMIDNMDQGIGRIVNVLRKTNALDNTLVFFLQDNGGCAEGLGRTARGKWSARPDQPPLAPLAADFLQPDMIPKQTRDGYPVVTGPGIMPGPADTYIAYGRGWANASNTPFREYKHWVHEGGISTPLIAHWPEQIKRAGQLDHQPGHLIDLVATCVDVSGAKYPKEVDGHKIKPLEGRSLVSAFAGKKIERDAIYWEHEGNRAVRVGNWKLVAKGAAGAWELYDVAADRAEMNNHANSKPKVVIRLAAKWQSFAERADVLPLVPYYKKRKKVARFSTKKLFELKSGADLAREQAPMVAGKPFTVTVTLQAPGRDGVLVAQGGVTDGWSLYTKDGHLTFATRHQGRLSIISGDANALSDATTVAAAIDKSGNVTVSVNGENIASGKVPGSLVQMPLDGLQVGSDASGAVGDYEAPFTFQGQIESVKLKIGK